MTEITVQLPEADELDNSVAIWVVNENTVYNVAATTSHGYWFVEIGMGDDETLQLPVDEAERCFLAGLAAVRECQHREKAAEIGCDFTPTCAAGETHMRDCLGAYRTQSEVDAGVVPDVAELERRQRDQRFHDAYMRVGGRS